MKEAEMKVVAKIISEVLENIGNNNVAEKAKKQVHELCKNFPLYKGVMF